VNPYIVKLSIVDDEATLNVSIWILVYYLICHSMLLFSADTKRKEAGPVESIIPAAWEVEAGRLKVQVRSIQIISK
jgi:hypothetical protein